MIRGSAPTHFVLCHDASLTSLKDFKHISMPSLTRLIDLYEQIAAGCGLYARPKTVGICINTSSLSPVAAKEYLQKVSDETGQIVVDPVRDYDRLDLILDDIIA